ATSMTGNPPSNSARANGTASRSRSMVRTGMTETPRNRACMDHILLPRRHRRILPGRWPRPRGIAGPLALLSETAQPLACSFFWHSAPPRLRARMPRIELPADRSAASERPRLPQFPGPPVLAAIGLGRALGLLRVEEGDL